MLRACRERQAGTGRRYGCGAETFRPSRLATCDPPTLRPETCDLRSET